MEYVIVLLSSLALLFLSLKQKKRIARWFFLALAILLPCILAGMRAYSVGSDVNMYVQPLYLKAKNTSFFEFVFHNSFMNDYLYLIATYLISNIFGSMFWLLLVIELLVIIPAYIAATKVFKKNGHIIIAMLAFYALLYNASFNMVRQSIALSFSFLAFAFLLNDKKKEYFIYTVVAILFHWSAIFSLVSYIILKTIRSERKTPRQKLLFKVIIIYCAIAAIFVIPNLNGLLSNIGLGNSKIASFIAQFSSDQFIGSSTADTLFFSFLLCLLIFLKGYYKKIDKDYDSFLYLLLLGIITMQFGSFVKFGYRLSYYYLYPPAILLIPKLSGHANKKKVLYGMTICAAFCFYWYFWVVIANYHGTYPYILAQ